MLFEPFVADQGRSQFPISGELSYRAPGFSLAMNSTAISGGIPGGISRLLNSAALCLSASDWPGGKGGLSMSPLHQRGIAPADAEPESRQTGGGRRHHLSALQATAAESVLQSFSEAFPLAPKSPMRDSAQG